MLAFELVVVLGSKRADLLFDEGEVGVLLLFGDRALDFLFVGLDKVQAFEWSVFVVFGEVLLQEIFLESSGVILSKAVLLVHVRGINDSVLFHSSRTPRLFDL